MPRGSEVRLVFGVGANNANYVTQKEETVDGKRKQTWICPYYRKWYEMLRRCYSKTYQQRYPTYLDCQVCGSWLYFMNFREWMSTQYWEGRHLDKDILFPGNKVYSPATCVFVTPRVNMFLTDIRKPVGDYPLGVSFDKSSRKFIARCQDGTGESKYLGSFTTPEQARNVYLEEKLRLAHILAAEQDDPRVAKSLIDRYTNFKEN